MSGAIQQKEHIMDLGIQDKVAIVTGAARGIGAAIARQLAEEGVKVVIADINEEGAKATTEALKKDGFAAHCVIADIAAMDGVKRLVAETVETFGSIDILVNNAGFPKDGYLTKMSEENWDIVLNVILKGAFLLTREVMPLMIEKKWGRVINMSSRAVYGNPGQANYAAAKAGLVGFTKALCLEEGKFGVTINAVAPGLVETEAVTSLPSYDLIKERAVKATPIPRVGKPEDIANAATFLASERASYITGELLHVTGGRYG